MGKDITVKPRYGTLYLEDLGNYTPDSIQFAFNDTNENIDHLREKLAILIASNPKDLMSKDDYEEYGGVMEFIKQKIDDILEDARDSYSKLERLTILDTILNEWEGNPYFDNDNTGMFDKVDFKDNEQIQAFVYPRDRKDESVKQEKINVEFFNKQHKSNYFEEIYGDCKKNLDMNHLMQENMNKLILAYIDGKIFVTFDGQFAFKNETEAMKAIEDQLDFDILNRIHKRYFDGEAKNSEKFYNDVIKYLDEEEVNFVKEYIEEIKKNDERYIIGTVDYSRFYELVKKSFINYLKDEHIHFVRINEIVRPL